MSLFPRSPEELAAGLAEAAANRRTIQLRGACSKDRFGGPLAPADVNLSTAQMTRVLEYEPKDLTISVEPGLPWSSLMSILAANQQTIPLDPPFHDTATTGGVLAANCSGPRRRLYGTARDAVIGMRLATLEGKLVQTGGMVVKNVAGLDIAKLMIGSFGTLAAIATANFKLVPIPPASRTFLFQTGGAEEALAVRGRILAGALQPAAIDLLNPAAAALLDRRGWLLAVQAGGSPRVIERYQRELDGSEILEGGQEASFWTGVREFVPRYLESSPDRAVVRSSATLSQLAQVVTLTAQPLVARAGNGVAYICFEEAQSAAALARSASAQGAPSVVETSFPGEQWPSPESGLAVMRRIKDMFDPHHLLNPGRLYGRL